MITGISTACFYPMLLENALESALSLGFKTLEIFINTEQEFGDRFVLPMKEQIDRAGARVVSVHAFSAAYEDFLFFSEYERRNEENLEKYCRYFDAAKKLGARYFTFHGKRNRRLTGMAPPVPEKDTICRAMRRLCRAAEESGISLAQENVAWCHSASVEYLKMLRDEVPELYFTLDIKQAWRAQVPVSRYIDVMGNRLANIHLNDAGTGETCLLPFRGEVDFDDILTRLSRIGYTGEFILEVYARNFTHPEELSAAAAEFDRMLVRHERREKQ